MISDKSRNADIVSAFLRKINRKPQRSARFRNLKRLSTPNADFGRNGGQGSVEAVPNEITRACIDITLIADNAFILCGQLQREH